jgi:tetratricopeptide (TPR) repeat protein
MTLFSCNRTNFSNPEEVIKRYRMISSENNNEILYDEYLSSKSKEYVTKDEFIKTRNTPDSIRNTTKLLDCKISSFPIDVNNPTYRRFKVDEKYIIKNDTVFNRLFYSAINENGKWKVIWTATLQSFAEKKYTDGNYSEARKTLEKILEIDPFSGVIYQLLAWCYYRDLSLTRNEWENGIVNNTKYAITLEDDNYLHYNTLASYYSYIGKTDLAILNYERSISFCLNRIEKAIIYSNLAGCYIETMNFNKAEECIQKSIEIDDKNAFVWYKYGMLMLAQNKNYVAVSYFEKALQRNKMENSVQKELYYSYAFCCYKIGKCEVASEYINKALDIEPNNNNYQALYNEIKYFKGKTE